MIVDGRELGPGATFDAVQKYILGHESELLGHYTHVFRICRRWWQQKTRESYHFRAPEDDYYNFKFATGEVPECVYRYYLEVVEPAQNALSADQPAE